MRAWRSARALVVTTQRGWPGFAYHAGANAVGTLTAIAVAYLVGIAAGVVAAVPVAVIFSVAGVAVAVTATALRLAPKRLLMARASELLDAEPGRVVATLRKIFVADDVDELDIFDVVWGLPEPDRTIVVVRFGEPMTLADIGEALGYSPERVRQLEGRALERVAEALGVDWRAAGRRGHGGERRPKLDPRAESGNSCAGVGCKNSDRGLRKR